MTTTAEHAQIAGPSDLYEVMRSSPACREFRTDLPVPRDVIVRILDNARFATNGDNRQPWRVIIVDDPEHRRILRDSTHRVMRIGAAYRARGMRSFSPKYTWGDGVVPFTEEEAAQTEFTNSFIEQMLDVPMILLICFEIDVLSVTDNRLGRQTIVGGASVYPFVQNIFLGARYEGLASLMVTGVLCQEPALREPFHIPETHGIACMVPIGYPVTVRTKLKRREVGEFLTLDTFDGPALG